MASELAQLEQERQQAIQILSAACERIYPAENTFYSDVEWAVIEALAVLQRECAVCGHNNPGHDSECPEKPPPL